MRIKLLCLALLFTSAISTSQTTAIPDSNFEQFLINQGWDDVIDGSVLTANIDTQTIVNFNAGPPGVFVTDLTGIEDFTALVELNVQSSNITSLDVSNNLLLEELNVIGTDLLALNVSANTNLRILQFGSTATLTSVDLSNNVNLEQLTVFSGSVLTGLDLSNNTALNNLFLQGQDLTLFTLDLSNNTALTDLTIRDSTINTVDLSQNVNLTDLIIFGGSLQTLDLSQNINLDFVNVGGSLLTTLDLSSNINLQQLSISTAPDLMSIDLTNCGLLNQLIMTNTPLLTSLDLTSCTSLITLQASTSGLTDVDVSQCPSLDRITLTGSSLNSLDITNNPVLTNLSIGGGNLNTIDLSNNPDLTFINLSNHNLTELDVSNNVNLETLNASQNNLTTINLFNNVNLTSLSLNDNNLVFIDINQNVALTSVNLRTNDLTVAALNNGNNTAITFLDIRFNQNLTCIGVDDPQFANENFTLKDVTANYNTSEDCNEEWIVYTTDTTFESQIVAIADTNGTGEVSYEEAQAYTGDINFSNLGIDEVTGLEAFTNANIVDLSDNNLTDINTYLLSESFIIQQAFPSTRTSEDEVRRPKIRIKSLNVARNNLTEVDISNTEGMESLDVSGNNLVSLTLAPGTAVTTRSTDALTFMDASDNPPLEGGCIQVNDVANAQSQAQWTIPTGCFYSTDCESALSADSFSLDDALNIGPNPTSDIIEINFPNHINLKSISLYGLDGQLLVSTNSNSLNIEGFGIGLYLLRIETDQGTLVKKIIKN